MSATNYFENALLALIFNNTSVPNIASGLGSAGNLYLSLHTANPGETGNQGTSETAYTGYARVQMIRSNVAWTVAGNEVSNTSVVTFPIATGGTSVVTHWGVGTGLTGAGQLLIYGPLTASLSISNGIRPIFDTSDLKITLE